MDNQQGPTTASGTLLNVICSLERREVWGRTYTCIHMAGSLAGHLKLSQHVNRLYLNTKQKVKLKKKRTYPLEQFLTVKRVHSVVPDSL